MMHHTQVVLSMPKILLTVLLAGYSMVLMAQTPAAPPDTLNFYQKVLLTLEQAGMPLETALKTPEFVQKLTEAGYSRDSLVYYYEELKKQRNASTPGLEPGTVEVLTKSYRDSIVLRWAPTTVDLWQRLDKTGYVIKRADLNERLEVKGETMITLADSLHPVKPWTLDQIVLKVQETDSAAMVAGQALYGEGFGSEASESSLDFVERNQVRNMRFGFGVLMADRSALAADLMGLRWVDRNVRPNQWYVYYVVPLDSAIVLPSISIVKNDPAQNDKVKGLKAVAGDNEVKLTWPRADNFFSGYWIERSADNGKTWQKRTPNVVVFMENDNPGPVTRSGDMVLSTLDNPAEEAYINYIFKDSTDNGITYQYRVSGQTAFADFTDYTYASASPQDRTPPPTPAVLRHVVDEKTNVATLEWSMGEASDLLADLAGFSVWEGRHPDSNFVQISPLLPPATRQFVSPKPLEKGKIHYYILKAFDQKGNETSTFPLYMHVIDDVPPAAPLNPAYVVDSTGVVTIVWEHNTEVDLMGYRVYFKNDPNAELTQLTRTPIFVNMFRDTVELLTMSERIYYQIQAVDLSHNRSEFSVVLEVQKPDILPPIAPILRYPTMNDSLIGLRWEPSSSEDVSQHVLYRRPYERDSVWEQLAILGPRDTAYTDLSAVEEVLYEYTLRAVDDAGLASDWAFPVKGRRWFGAPIPNVENFTAAYSDSTKTVQLRWEYAPPVTGFLAEVDYSFSLYRAVGTGPLMRYRLFDRNTTAFFDPKSKNDGQYQYAVMVIFKNGKTSALSQTQTVLVKKQ
jgi:uncharacterized protein